MSVRSVSSPPAECGAANFVHFFTNSIATLARDCNYRDQLWGKRSRPADAAAGRIGADTLVIWLHFRLDVPTIS
jgi:hypothetical protein